MVRAKFTVTEITERSWDGGRSKLIVLQPQYDTSIPENQRYATATPSGRIEMHVDNPAAIAALPLGGQFYVDFTPVPKLEEGPA